MAMTKYHNNNNLRYCFIFLSINISISFTKNPNIPSHHECATYAAQNAWCKHWNHTIVQGVHQSLESICRSKMFWSKTSKTYYILVDLKSTNISTLKYGKKKQNFTENIFDNLILAIIRFHVHPVPLYHSFEKNYADSQYFYSWLINQMESNAIF